MRIKNRYTAKPWFKKWMMWVLMYPYYFAKNIMQLHSTTKDDVHYDLYEWTFQASEPDQ